MSYPPFSWPPIPSGGAVVPPGTSTALVLDADVDRWLDPDNGNDSNPGTLANPWLTFAPFKILIESYVSIEANARLHILASEFGNVPQFTGLTAPTLGQHGKVVLLGIGVTENTGEAGPGTFVASGTSTTLVINTALYPYGGDPRGWIAECVAGANLNVRVAIGQGTAAEGGAASLVPAAPLSFAGIGDTWRMIRPSAELFFPATVTCTGPGRGTGADPDGNDQGLYIANLRISGTPTFAFLSTWFYSAEAFGSDLVPGCNCIFGEDCFAGFGVTGGFALPWIDPNAALWNGAGLTAIFDVTRASPNVTDLILQFGNFSAAAGYVCGTTWHVSGLGASGIMDGGGLWGNVAADSNPVDVRGGARMSIGVNGGTICGVRNDNEAANGVIYCQDPDSLITLGHVALLPTGDLGATTTLLRATNGGEIDCVSDFGAPSGSTTGTAQDASGDGVIVWDSQPALVGTIELQVTGIRGFNSQLASAASGLRDALNISRIVRRTIALPVTASEQQSPPMPPFNAGSIFCEVAAGVAVTAVPAPPSGQVNLIIGCSCKNADAVNAGTPELSVGGVPIGLTGSVVGSGQGIGPITGGVVAAEGAVTASRIAGASSSLKFYGAYVQVPKANLVPVIISLSAVFQSIPSIVPPAGWVARVLGNSFATNSAPSWSLNNGDNVVHTATWQITRGALVIVFNGTSAGITNRTTNSGTNFPVILPGDLVEVKTNEAITTPGTVGLTGVMEFVRAAL